MTIVTLQHIKELLLKERIFLLYGSVGAGKTYLVEKLLGPVVKSPTYAGSYIYNITLNQKNLQVWHCDLYMKVPTLDEIIYVIETFDLIFIEWPENLSVDVQRFFTTLPTVKIKVYNNSYKIFD